MFPLPITAWLGIGGLVVILALGVGVKIQTSRLADCKTEAAVLRAQVKATGDAAEAARQKDILDRKAISDKQEQDNAKRYATLDAKYRAALAAARLPRNDPGSSQAQPLSSAAAELSCPDGQADIAGRLADLEVGILGLLQRGDKAIERTVTCKLWLDEQVKK